MFLSTWSTRSGSEPVSVASVVSAVATMTCVGLIHDGLGVVAVDEAVGLAEHDAAIGIGEVALGLRLGDGVGIATPVAGPGLERGPGLAQLA